jgi:hypothetical protein
MSRKGRSKWRRLPCSGVRQFRAQPCRCTVPYEQRIMPDGPSTQPNQPPQKTSHPLKRWPYWITFAIVLVLNYVLVSQLSLTTQSQRTEISYTFPYIWMKSCCV